MEASSEFTFFIAATTVFSVALFMFAVFCFSSRRKWSNWLGTSCFSALLVLLSYVASILAQSFFAMSVLSSIYFCCIDLMIATLLGYLAGSKGLFRKRSGYHRAFLVVGILVIADCTSLMLNPLSGHALGFAADPTGGVAQWDYVPFLPYKLHLALDYALIVCIIAILVYKVATTPAVYHARYIPIIVMILLIVLLNAVFLSFSFHILDISVLLYAFCAGFICTNDYLLQERALKRRVSDKIIDTLGHPVVFFDNEKLLCQHNEDAAFLFDGVDNPEVYTMRRFVARNGLASDLGIHAFESDCSFRWARANAEGRQPYRCDFRILRDEKQRVIGYLFVFIDISLEVDALTGFQTKEALFRDLAELEAQIALPACVCLLDLNRLAELNAHKGRAYGDEAIRKLASTMRNVFPPGTAFARMDDATLLACCPSMRQAEARKRCSAITRAMGASDFDGWQPSVQSTVGELGAERDLRTTISLANRSLLVQKMLNPNSAHSSLLDSLEQTLRESDATTEAHVRRTRALAAKLGEKLELSDYDQSSLALLCLLHDIGKLGIPLEILNKPSKLTDEEWDLMRSHVDKGYRIAMASEELSEIAPYILHHHESWDGSGYPDGLKSDAIPLLSRIVAVVDTFDAMTNNRPYRSALSAGQARAELQRCAGTQFDPQLVAKFLEVLEEMGLTGDGEQPAEASQAAKKSLPRSFTEGEREEGALKGLASVDYAEYLLDETDHIVEINEGFTRLTGYTEDDIAQLRPRQIDLIFPEDAELYYALVDEQLKGGSEAFVEHRVRRKDGSARHVLCHGKQIFDSVSHTPRVAVIAVDAARTATTAMLLRQERERSRRNVDYWERGARIDSLTGVLNHQAFVNSVQALASARDTRVMLCIVDLDNFKLYNDRYGHPRGDELLVLMAEALGSCAPANSIVGRLGGDEFATAIPCGTSCDDATAAQIVQELWRAVMERLANSPHPAAITMGAYLAAPAGDASFQLLYDNADAVLYEAKEAGRGRVCFESSTLSCSLDRDGNTESTSYTG